MAHFPTYSKCPDDTFHAICTIPINSSDTDPFAGTKYYDSFFTEPYPLSLLDIRSGPITDASSPIYYADYVKVTSGISIKRNSDGDIPTEIVLPTTVSLQPIWSECGGRSIFYTVEITDTQRYPAIFQNGRWCVNPFSGRRTNQCQRSGMVTELCGSHDVTIYHSFIQVDGVWQPYTMYPAGFHDPNIVRIISEEADLLPDNLSDMNPFKPYLNGSCC